MGPGPVLLRPGRHHPRPPVLPVEREQIARGGGGFPASCSLSTGRGGARGAEREADADPVATQANPAAPADQKKEPEPDPRTLEELLAELDGLIGLRAVKAEIHRQVALLKVEAKRKEAGLKTPAITRHLVFVGNPGTGKTTVARLVGGIYRALGLLSKGQLIEVDRSELVAGYLGQTAMKRPMS